LFATVAHIDDPEGTTQDIYNEYKKVGNQIGALVVPAGLAWRKFASTTVEPTKINFLYIDPIVDKKHPSSYGVLLNAYVFYGALFGGYTTDLQGFPIVYSTNENLDPTMVASLKLAAQQTLIDNNILNDAHLKFNVIDIHKSLESPTFTETATSNNQSSPIIYEIDNSAVANVDATGQVTINGEGRAVITVSQIAGTYNSVYYPAASDSYELTVAASINNPAITVISTPYLIVSQVDSTHLDTIRLSGVHLTNNISISISGTNANLFTLLSNSLTQTGGIVPATTVNIQYKPTSEGRHFATLTISSDGAPTLTRYLTANATLVALSKPTVLDGTETSISGFIANWLPVLGASEYQLDVFKRVDNGKSTVLAENFNLFALGTPDAGASSTVLPVGLNAYTQVAGWTSSKVFQAGGTIKIGTNSLQGYLLTPAINLSKSSGAFNLSFRAMAWLNEATSMKIYVDNVLVDTVTGLNNSTYSFSTYSLDLTGGISTSKVKFEANAAANSRFFLDDVVITQNNYITTPISGSPFVGISGINKILDGLESGTDYYYTVTAKNSRGSSLVSNVVKVTTNFSTGIENLNNSLQLSLENGKITFSANTHETVEVYNALGQKLVSKTAENGLNNIWVSIKGLLLVKVGTRVAKVIGY
jgi:hypothetical protein